jgi:hypothetical protein
MTLLPLVTAEAATRPPGVSFFESEMRPIFVVIVNVVFQQPSQAPLVQNDYVVQELRRTLPTQRSATPFCHRLRSAVRTGWEPIAFTGETTSEPNFESRSKIRKRRGRSPHSQTSCSCNATQSAFEVRADVKPG